jgi:hypothetical protein
MTSHAAIGRYLAVYQRRCGRGCRDRVLARRAIDLISAQPSVDAYADDRELPEVLMPGRPSNDTGSAELGNPSLSEADAA